MVKKLYFFTLLYLIFVVLLISSQEPTFNYINIAGGLGAGVSLIYIGKSKRVKSTSIYNWKGLEVKKQTNPF